jgi:hypothetical protein
MNKIALCGWSIQIEEVASSYSFLHSLSFTNSKKLAILMTYLEYNAYMGSNDI